MADSDSELEISDDSGPKTPVKSQKPPESEKPKTLEIDPQQEGDPDDDYAMSDGSEDGTQKSPEKKKSPIQKADTREDGEDDSYSADGGEEQDQTNEQYGSNEDDNYSQEDDKSKDADPEFQSPGLESPNSEIDENNDGGGKGEYDLDFEEPSVDVTLQKNKRKTRKKSSIKMPWDEDEEVSIASSKGDAIGSSSFGHGSVSSQVMLLREERDKRWAVEKQLQELQEKMDSLQREQRETEIRALKAEKSLRTALEAEKNSEELKQKVSSLQKALEEAESALRDKESGIDFVKDSQGAPLARPATTFASSKRLDGNLSKQQLEEELYRASERLVKEAERSSQLAIKISNMGEELNHFRSENEDLRTQLIEGLLTNGKVNQQNYKHISLSELMRLRLIQENEGAGFGGGSASVGSLRSAMSTRQGRPTTMMSRGMSRGMGSALGSPGKSIDPSIQEVEDVRALEIENKNLQAKVIKLSEKLETMGSELSMAVGVNDDVAVLKAKAMQLVDRQKMEKEGRLKAEQQIVEADQKIEILSDHIEKLMFHLKHEAAAKAKAYGAQRRVQRELELLKARNAALLKKNQSREKVILELKEGSKILEDQLRLMDEKYIELRTKLDWQRSKSEKELKKYKNQAADLRMKWSYLNPDGSLLDEVDVDFDPAGGQSGQFANTTGKIRLKPSKASLRPNTTKSDLLQDNLTRNRPVTTSTYDGY